MTTLMFAESLLSHHADMSAGDILIVLLMGIAVGFYAGGVFIGWIADRIEKDVGNGFEGIEEPPSEERRNEGRCEACCGDGRTTDDAGGVGDRGPVRMDEGSRA